MYLSSLQLEGQSSVAFFQIGFVKYKTHYWWYTIYNSVTQSTYKVRSFHVECHTHMDENSDRYSTLKKV